MNDPGAPVLSHVGTRTLSQVMQDENGLRHLRPQSTEQVVRHAPSFTHVGVLEHMRERAASGFSIIPRPDKNL